MEVKLNLTSDSENLDTDDFCTITVDVGNRDVNFTLNEDGREFSISKKDFSKLTKIIDMEE